MATCAHCGTAFSPATPEEQYCCKGCEFVAEMIHDAGFDRFYDLKQGLATAPVRSRPFEEHDFSWTTEKIARAETEAESRGGSASLDCALEGISCVGCVWLIEKLFEKHPGAIRAAAHPASGRLHLEWQPGACDVPDFLRELTRFGYVAGPARSDAPDGERRRLTARLGLCGAFALNAMGFSLPGYLGMPPDFQFAGLFHLIAFLSATFALLVGGGYFIDRAWRALRAGSLHIDLPIALGLLLAYFGSIAGWALGIAGLRYFDFVATFVFLMLAGRYLQTAAVDRNRRRLLRASPIPPSVRSGEDTLALESLQPGQSFAIRPGQALPVAATVSDQRETGRSRPDPDDPPAAERKEGGQSCPPADDPPAAEVSLEWINGEADPVLVHPGTRLPAGAILLSRQDLVLTADQAWADSLLARLARRDDTERGSPLLQKVLRAYLGLVLLFGVGGLVGWILAGQMTTGLQAMISVFVVSCPCALGVAIPLADELAASRAERQGAFVRAASLWSRLRHVRQVIFDKTGTLTLERPVLLDSETVTTLPDDAVLALARLTAGSLHPVGRTLHEALGTRGQRLLAQHGPAEIQDHPGQGVSFSGTRNSTWSLGRAGWSGDEADGTTSLCHDGERIAAFRFRDSIRPDTHETLDALRQRGCRLHILSGDTPDKVAHLAGELGIGEARGGLDPEQKAERVRELDRHDTLYLGDGANDSLAFDAAHVTGTPVVDRSLLEAKSDFYTLGSGLAFLPELFRIADLRARGVRNTFGFAVAYNAIAVALCLAGHMNPLLAAILMPISSIISVLLVTVRSGARRASLVPRNPGG